MRKQKEKRHLEMVTDHDAKAGGEQMKQENSML